MLVMCVVIVMMLELVFVVGFVVVFGGELFIWCMFGGGVLVLVVMYLVEFVLCC